MEQLFSRLGLNDKEADTFMKLLPLGAQPVSIIAKHVGVPRSSMYVIIARLVERGLVEEFERTGVRYVKCIPVAAIQDVLRSEQQSVEYTLKLLNDKLPMLQALENTLSITPKVKLLEGKQAIMTMYQTLSREKEFCTYFNPLVFKQVGSDYPNIIPEVLRESGGRAREIVVESDEAEQYRKKYESDRHQIRMMPKKAAFQTDCIICKDRISFVTYGEDQIASVIIFSPTLATAQRAIFDLVWDTLK